MPRPTPKHQRLNRAPVRPQLPPQARKAIMKPAPRRVQSPRSGFRG